MAGHVPRRVLLTGGAGFIGCALARRLLADGVERLVVLDALTPAGDRARLADVEGDHRLRFVHGDVGDAPLASALLADEAIGTVIHCAAESHVDRSIDDPLAALRANALGTAVLLDAARRAWRGRDDVRFHHVSTDEVFGPVAPGAAVDEAAPYAPSSPYAAGKASADHCVRAWARTYGIPATITWGANTYGPWQFPEKLVPLAIMRALAGELLPLYGDGAHERDWLHVDDHVEAVLRCVRAGTAGGAWCVGGGAVCANRDLVALLCRALDAAAPDPGGPYARLVAHVADRPGHDRRYAMDCARIRADLGWTPRVALADGLTATVRWYLDHRAWWEGIRRTRYDGRRLGLPR